MYCLLDSPMEAFICNPVFSVSMIINTAVLNLILVTLLAIVVNLIQMGHNYIINNNWQIVRESLYRTILIMIENFVGRKFSIYLPLLYSVFYLIFFSNFIGLIPYSSTPTVEIVMTLSLAFTLLFGILIVGFLNHKLYLLAVFLPAGTPAVLVPLMIFLEVIAFIFRTISLGLRLAINLITGHVLAKVCVGFIWLGVKSGTHLLILMIPILFLSLFLALEVLIAYLQAYIFLFITCLTLKDLA